MTAVKEETQIEAQPAMEVKEMTAAQLVQMAPFMSRETIEEIALGIAGPMTAAEMTRIAPFIGPECVEALLEKHSPALEWDTLRKLAPFMSRDAVDALARRIASGETVVQPSADPFNKAVNDIGKAFDDIGKGLEKGLGQFGKDLEKGFDDFGKGVDKAMRKAIRFGENVVSEVSKAINAEEELRRAGQERAARTRALRKRAFERAVADGRWDWLGLHIAEVNDDPELKAAIAASARALGMHDWICAHMSDYADMETIDNAIAHENWEWLGENVWQFGADVHEKAALAAVEARNWEWLRLYSDPLEILNCGEEIARAAMAAGENALAAQFAEAHLVVSQVDVLAGEAYAAENFGALGLLLNQCSAAFQGQVLLELAQKGDWTHALDYVRFADADLLERLMEAAVEQGNFDAIDLLDALL